MAFDGITISNIVAELNHTIVNGKNQTKSLSPEADELIFTIKNQRSAVPAVSFRQRVPSADLSDGKTTSPGP